MNGFTSDEVLYGQLIHGDVTALDMLYGRYHLHLFGFILAQLGNRQDAEDVLHDAFLAVLRERQGGHGTPTCFRAWIYQVARNLWNCEITNASADEPRSSQPCCALRQHLGLYLTRSSTPS
jgi:DNA-directed RNA polymerase specialized sigma24 family protein